MKYYTLFTCRHASRIVAFAAHRIGVAETKDLTNSRRAEETRLGTANELNAKPDRHLLERTTEKKTLVGFTTSKYQQLRYHNDTPFLRRENEIPSLYGTEPNLLVPRNSWLFTMIGDPNPALRIRNLSDLLYGDGSGRPRKRVGTAKTLPKQLVGKMRNQNIKSELTLSTKYFQQSENTSSQLNTFRI